MPNELAARRDYLWPQLRDLPYFRAMLRAVEAEFYQDYPLPRPVLDVGCGDGHFASVTFESPLDVGLDPWAEPIRQARHLNGYRSLVQADGASIPFPDAHFSSAVSNSVLEHIPNIQQVLPEIARVLKPDARFLFCVPNPGYLSELVVPRWLSVLGLASLSRAYRDWFQRMSRVHHAVTAETWQSWLEQAGFALEKHWDYFSPQAMRVLELGHFWGAPTLLPHALTGRWIVAPYRWNLWLTARFVKKYIQAAPHSQGTFTFYVARKA